LKYENKNSKFAQHLLENKHPIDPMESIMETVHITNKGPMIDTIEEYYIFRKRKLNYQINDKLIIKPNLIFETVVHKDAHRGLPVTCNP
jgi:hypothetical protein